MAKSSFDSAQICLNGHVVTSHYHDFPQFRKSFCSDCGEKTITACGNCQAEIQGSYRDGFSIDYGLPAFCQECGSPFPWTERALAAAADLAEDLDELGPDEKANLKASLADLIRSGPRTSLAETRFKRLMSKVRAESYQAMRSILIDVLSESVKRSIFGVT
ncbi:MAG TPA: DUF2321 domain-containing protein [Rhodothermales bacterium]|nr:DUF2321 domain-containing protein [Rhodothermales bacterium]